MVALLLGLLVMVNKPLTAKVLMVEHNKSTEILLMVNKLLLLLAPMVALVLGLLVTVNKPLPAKGLMVEHNRPFGISIHNSLIY
jgi:hypothetical protein